ncbi:hypothetical protein EV356DRAFT_438187 [Viridothelium virens]|uniref:D-isomer specific 2-hydroxyacid dehydrogenase NAD-binding domain-containing protein n=1 Tax=Viridothelium virens TaxID=1048519 RepID=A0A6A6HQ99_VIRVR|nr:hypothetical protein EV356DRAFT_438187 [Viridothelium virens]
MNGEDIPAQELSSLYQSCTILTTLLCYPPNLESVPNLRLVHTPGAGIDYALDNPVFSAPQIRATTSNGIAAPPIAEWFIGQLINHTRTFDRWQQQQDDRKWDAPIATLFQTPDLVGQRLGVLGYGSIGRQAARVASALGMKVLAYTAKPKATPESKRDRNFVVEGLGDPEGTIPSEWFSGTDKESLHKFLAQKLDVLLISLPLTSSSRHIIGKKEFRVLKENSPHGCFLANVARGDVLVQDDLVQALIDEDSGLNGVALDVATPEPLPSDSPLWTSPRCTITPHISSVVAATTDRIFQVLDANLSKAPGEKLINEMEKGRGY